METTNINRMMVNRGNEGSDDMYDVEKWKMKAAIIVTEVASSIALVSK